MTKNKRLHQSDYYMRIELKLRESLKDKETYEKIRKQVCEEVDKYISLDNINDIILVRSDEVEQELNERTLRCLDMEKKIKLENENTLIIQIGIRMKKRIMIKFNDEKISNYMKVEDNIVEAKVETKELKTTKKTITEIIEENK
jgi:hypothetical protein